MPGHSWDNESSYRRRLAAILPVVVILLASLASHAAGSMVMEVIRYVKEVRS